MRFGQKVRKLRTEKHLSQTTLAEKCGLTLRTIRNYEVDGRYPKKREVYTLLAETLGCSVNYLLSEEETCVYGESAHGSLDRLKETVLDSIAELKGYLEDDDYDDLEKHDCRVAVETYEKVLSVIKTLKEKEV